MRMSERLDNLEIKSAYAEDLLDELNRIVGRQQLQIDQLQRELNRLRQQIDSEGPGAGTRNLRDELPPHW
jgi:SlyX protein